MARPNSRMSAEQIAVQKAHRVEMHRAIESAILNYETDSNPIEMFPEVGKRSQLEMLEGINEDRHMKRKTARFQSIYNSLGSGFSVHHVIWVCSELDKVGCKFIDAPHKITPESIVAHRELHIASSSVLSEGADEFAAWALSKGPDFIKQVNALTQKHHVYDKDAVEQLMATD